MKHSSRERPVCRSALQNETGTTHRSFPTGKGDRKMKATGIVRRVNDLGRVVIPKEIRRTMRIREGDPSRIHTDLDVFGKIMESIITRYEKHPEK